MLAVAAALEPLTRAERRAGEFLGLASEHSWRKFQNQVSPSVSPIITAFTQREIGFETDSRKGDFVELLRTACEAAKVGGNVLQMWRHKFTAREKSPADLVTEADVASQQAVFEYIHDRYPDHRYLGEEGLDHGERDSPVRWIIDPLDGTSNYVHGFPYYAVSIGVEQAGELVAGAIFDPTRDELFAAVQGGGATLNGSPISVSDQSDLSSALCMASLPVKTDRSHPAVQRFLRVLEHAQHVQRTGSAALNLCGVACGRVDAFWSHNLKPWDMAAGVVIVREAGGCVTTAGGDVFDVDRPDLLATNGKELHEELSRMLVQR